MLPETVLALAEDPRVCAREGGLREASTRPARSCGTGPPGFSVLSGEDSLALPMIACGADGVIAVVSNEAPALLVALVEAALSGDRDEAAQLQAKLFPLMRANFRESNPIPVKWALHRLGLIQDVLRLPLVPLSKAQHKPMEEALKEAGLLDDAGNPVEEAP